VESEGTHFDFRVSAKYPNGQIEEQDSLNRKNPVRHFLQMVGLSGSQYAQATFVQEVERTSMSISSANVIKFDFTK
jgi:hypothetical protein